MFEKWFEPRPLDVNKTIELLLSDPAKQPPTFPFEREIRLFQFRAWVYFPTEIEIPQRAARIIATEYLRHLEAGSSYEELDEIKTRTTDATTYEKLFQNSEYRDLFDAIIGGYGGWTTLLDTPTPTAFEKEVEARIKVSETVAEMIDYRFRYLDHGGHDPNMANISRSEYFRWTHPDKKISWKTIRSRWQKGRKSAAFIYVGDHYDWGLSGARTFGFPLTLIAAAANRRRALRYFGYVAYVLEKLQADSDEDSIQIPKEVKRIRPQTEPLTPEELERMTKYDEEKDEMREN